MSTTNEIPFTSIVLVWQQKSHRNSKLHIKLKNNSTIPVKCKNNKFGVLTLQKELMSQYEYFYDYADLQSGKCSHENDCAITENTSLSLKLFKRSVCNSGGRFYPISSPGTLSSHVVLQGAFHVSRWEYKRKYCTKQQRPFIFVPIL